MPSISWLAERACFAFDFSGHGDNIGHLREVRLSKRSPRAKSAPQVMAQRPTVLIEASMRGHVASNIVADVEPEFLILFCLALFGDDSIDLPFASARPQPSGSH